VTVARERQVEAHSPLGSLFRNTNGIAMSVPYGLSLRKSPRTFTRLRRLQGTYRLRFVVGSVLTINANPFLAFRSDTIPREVINHRCAQRQRAAVSKCQAIFG
jgi:hypothetical protein